MTLSRKRPLPAHTWPQGIDAGPPQTCETCGTEWREGFDSPPPWACRRSQLQSSGSGLQRIGGGLKRTKGVRARNPERMKRRRYSRGVKHTYGDFFRWSADRSCFACGSYPCVPHHVEKVGNGGTDPENLVDTCHDCHTRIEQEGVEAWGEAVGVSHPRKRLEARTSELWRLYRRERPEEAARLMEVVG